MRWLNQRRGKSFETRLVWQAQRTGLWLIDHGVKTRYVRGGKTITVKSDLDFRLYDRTGRSACFDAKTFSNDYFVYSDLTPHQVLRSAEYAQWGVPSGFVVHFQQAQQVVYFPIQIISGRGRRSRFEPEDGRVLGPDNNFALRLVLA